MCHNQTFFVLGEWHYYGEIFPFSWLLPFFLLAPVCPIFSKIFTVSWVASAWKFCTKNTLLFKPEKVLKLNQMQFMHQLNDPLFSLWFWVLYTTIPSFVWHGACLNLFANVRDGYFCCFSCEAFVLFHTDISKKFTWYSGSSGHTNVKRNTIETATTIWSQMNSFRDALFTVFSCRNCL